MSFDAIRWSYQQPLTITMSAVLAYLCFCADEYNKCYPGVDKIADGTGIGRRTVIKVLGYLAMLGLIVVQTRNNGFGRRTNLYFIPVGVTVSAEQVNEMVHGKVAEGRGSGAEETGKLSTGTNGAPDAPLQESKTYNTCASGAHETPCASECISNVHLSANREADTLLHEQPVRTASNITRHAPADRCECPVVETVVEPETKPVRQEPVAEDKAGKKPKRKSATLIPEDWLPGEQALNWLTDRGVTMDQIMVDIIDFRAYWSTVEKKYANWDLVFMRNPLIKKAIAKKKASAKVGDDFLNDDFGLNPNVPGSFFDDNVIEGEYREVRNG